MATRSAHALSARTQALRCLLTTDVAVFVGGYAAANDLLSLLQAVPRSWRPALLAHTGTALQLLHGTDDALVLPDATTTTDTPMALYAGVGTTDTDNELARIAAASTLVAHLLKDRRTLRPVGAVLRDDPSYDPVTDVLLPLLLPMGESNDGRPWAIALSEPQDPPSRSQPTAAAAVPPAAASDPVPQSDVQTVADDALAVATAADELVPAALNVDAERRDDQAAAVAAVVEQVRELRTLLHTSSPEVLNHAAVRFSAHPRPYSERSYVPADHPLLRLSRRAWLESNRPLAVIKLAELSQGCGTLTKMQRCGGHLLAGFDDTTYGRYASAEDGSSVTVVDPWHDWRDLPVFPKKSDYESAHETPFIVSRDRGPEHSPGGLWWRGTLFRPVSHLLVCRTPPYYAGWHGEPTHSHVGEEPLRHTRHPSTVDSSLLRRSVTCVSVAGEVFDAAICGFEGLRDASMTCGRQIGGKAQRSRLRRIDDARNRVAEHLDQSLPPSRRPAPARRDCDQGACEVDDCLFLLYSPQAGARCEKFYGDGPVPPLVCYATGRQVTLLRRQCLCPTEERHQWMNSKIFLR